MIEFTKEELEQMILNLRGFASMRDVVDKLNDRLNYINQLDAYGLGNKDDA